MRLPFAVIALLVLVPAFATAQTAAPQVNAIDVDSYVSPRLDPAEQDYFRDEVGPLRLLVNVDPTNISPDSISVAVIDSETGTVHYSRPEDVGTWHRRASSEDDPEGITNDYDPGYYAKSGPYRRVYTIPVPGSNGEYNDASEAKGIEGTVTVACTDGTHKKGDEGHIYLGGWSTTPNADGGTVDAGLQYNYKQSDKSGDNYSPFINLGKAIGYWFKDAPPGNPKAQIAGKIPCGGSVTMGFGMIHTLTTAGACKHGAGSPSCQRYDLVLEILEPGTTTVLQAVIWAPPYRDSPGTFEGGWGQLEQLPDNGGYTVDTSCPGCIFKWMTSIAQPPPGRYTDGSTFSATWSNREISCALIQTCGDGPEGPVPLTDDITDCSEYPLWTTYSDSSQDCMNTPSSVTGVAASVQVSGYSATGETDSISLTH